MTNRLYFQRRFRKLRNFQKFLDLFSGFCYLGFMERLGNKKGTGVRMQEVASRAGVSVATVSRVLAGGQDVAPHLQEKVILVVNELGYRKLRGKTPGSVPANKVRKVSDAPAGNSNKMVWVYSGLGESSPHLFSPWAKQVRAGLSHGAILNDFQIVYETLERAPSDACSHIPEENLAGVLIMPHDTTDTGRLLSGIPAGTPAVIINRRSTDTGVPSIDIDQHIGAFEVTLFLLNIGHGRIMTFTHEEPASITEKQRLEGYKQAFKHAGLTVDDSLIIREPPGEDWVNWPEVFRNALSLKPTAILLPNHGRVAHVMEILANQGLRVPEDISLIIFDDDPSLVRMTPSISAVRQPLDEMGRVAMGLIVKMRDAKESVASHTRLQPELIMRRSVKQPGRSD